MIPHGLGADSHPDVGNARARRVAKVQEPEHGKLCCRRFLPLRVELPNGAAAAAKRVSKVSLFASSRTCLSLSRLFLGCSLSQSIGARRTLKLCQDSVVSCAGRWVIDIARLLVRGGEYAAAWAATLLAIATWRPAPCVTLPTGIATHMHDNIRARSCSTTARLVLYAWHCSCHVYFFPLVFATVPHRKQ